MSLAIASCRRFASSSVVHVRRSVPLGCFAPIENCAKYCPFAVQMRVPVLGASERRRAPAESLLGRAMTRPSPSRSKASRRHASTRDGLLQHIIKRASEQVPESFGGRRQPQMICDHVEHLPLVFVEPHYEVLGPAPLRRLYFHRDGLTYGSTIGNLNQVRSRAPTQLAISGPMITGHRARLVPCPVGRSSAEVRLHA